MLTRGLCAVLFAQFLSALADNALLFAAIALLKSRAYPDWSIPVLQEFFVAAYILLSPFVGPIADSFAKGRVMLWANGLKLIGGLGLLLGLNPFIAYGMVGVGAAVYSPAKYGILSEMVGPQDLVKANGWMESSTIAAILCGALAGGVLADQSVTMALVAVCAMYAIAALANTLIPRLPAQHAQNLAPVAMIKAFMPVVLTLMKDRDARFSVVGTSLFWGAGATLRFLLVAWVPVALAITSNAMPAYMNAATAVGIVLGAALAAPLISLANAHRAVWAGTALGVTVAALSITQHLYWAFGLCALVGLFGGLFVVPLNALLQERGHKSVGAGSAIAVQNLFENILMLIMIGGYSLLAGAGLAPAKLALCLGGTFVLACLALQWSYGSARQQAATP